RLKAFDSSRTLGRRVLLDRTSGGRPIDTLVRLFLLRVPVPEGALARAISPLPVDRLVCSRLAAPVASAEGREYVSGFDLLPYEGLALVFDRPPRDNHEPYADYVMGVGGSTASLGMQMIRRPSRLTLDLGCGCGVLAFLASRFSERVIAADRNPRALAMARFNAALNEIANVEVIETDFFSGVKGRVFDLIVSNPPFVISPGRTYIYRDGGMERDGVTETVVRGCGEHLAPGGFAHVLCNWAHLAGTPWEDRLASWSSPAGADMLVLRTHTRDPVEYAQQWVSETERHLTTEQSWTRLDEWTAALRSQKIEAISGGLVSLHKTDGRPGWFDHDTSPEQGAGYTGEHLARMFAGRDFLLSIGGERELLSRRLRCSENLRLSQHVRLTDEGWRLFEAEARIDPGYPFGGVLEPLVMQFVLRMEGRETVGEGLAAVAEESGRDPRSLMSGALSVIGHLIRRGILIPVG
ncbi:MAG TPA: methyltransferase, partial [Phycisphaerales bacterium]|nr:methyltransferase [Phycisphaerales bacterium]